MFTLTPIFAITHITIQHSELWQQQRRASHKHLWVSKFFSAAIAMMVVELSFPLKQLRQGGRRESSQKTVDPSMLRFLLLWLPISISGCFMIFWPKKFYFSS